MRRPSRKILKLAAEVRREVLGWVKEAHPSFARDDMGQLCGLASYTLYRLLRAMGLSPLLVSYYDVHVWVELGGYVVDVTATQFDKDLPDVVVQKIGDYNPERLSTIRSNSNCSDTAFYSSDSCKRWYGNRVIAEINTWGTWHNLRSYRKNIERYVSKVRRDYGKKAS